MRIAIVSDIHGNRTAFEAVLADLRITSPDLVLHGGDLADGGSSPAEVVDRIIDLGWQGVLGNADEMLPNPESLEVFISHKSSHLVPLFKCVRDIAAFTREILGDERLKWLQALPLVVHVHESIALVHASPGSTWHAPPANASDTELKSVYGPLDRRIVVYGHIHSPFIRTISGTIIANSGSVGLSYDGDPRAAYLLIDDDRPTIRRVEYDIKKEQKALVDVNLPHVEWIAAMQETGWFQMP